VDAVKSLLIIEGSSAEVEERVNACADEYQPLSFTVSVVQDGIRVTAICVRMDKLQPSQLAIPQFGMPPGPRRQ